MIWIACYSWVNFTSRMLDPAWSIDTKCKADKSRHTLTLLSNHSKFPTVPHATFIRQLIYTFSSSTSFFHFFSVYPLLLLLSSSSSTLLSWSCFFPILTLIFFSHLFLTLGRSISRVRANIRLLFDQDNLFPFCLPKLDKTYHLLHLLHLTLVNHLTRLSRLICHNRLTHLTPYVVSLPSLQWLASPMI